MARSLNVSAAEMPKLAGPGYQVRVALGETGEARRARTEDFTLLDGVVSGDAKFSHRLPGGQAVWIYAVSGELQVEVNGERRAISAGSSVVAAAGIDDSDLSLGGGMPILS
ncbi:hypothetical protein BraRD5C2_67510 [Bradyrhizobium sp. RD5-C2]|nr:hypothetical protein BraRD5C2_67510 [Bradyrhizobium sp. RD5-C2]